ncbi:MAG: hypothetical protein BJ554DRAFT_8426, partial [Olpidium bornovanus]
RQPAVRVLQHRLPSRALTRPLAIHPVAAPFDDSQTQPDVMFGTPDFASAAAKFRLRDGDGVGTPRLRVCRGVDWCDERVHEHPDFVSSPVRLRGCRAKKAKRRFLWIIVLGRATSVAGVAAVCVTRLITSSVSNGGRARRPAADAPTAGFAAGAVLPGAEQQRGVAGASPHSPPAPPPPPADAAAALASVLTDHTQANLGKQLRELLKTKASAANLAAAARRAREELARQGERTARVREEAARVSSEVAQLEADLRRAREELDAVRARIDVVAGEKLDVDERLELLQAENARLEEMLQSEEKKVLLGGLMFGGGGGGGKKATKA